MEIRWLHNPVWQDLAALHHAWHAAAPFAHVVIDDVLPAADVATLFAIIDDEPVEFGTSDIYAFDATAPVPTTVAMASLRDGFAKALSPLLTELCGRENGANERTLGAGPAVTRVDMRAYAYRPGHYLLPHTDHQDELGRIVAYAYYLPTPAPPVGGELELFAAHVQDGQLGSATSTQVFTPKPNRLVMFEVSERSLHQVREVVDGLRLSLAGWFYP
ncbi:MAG: 2OG-Fe(II) oxygenase [Kofleriaceae bacterium]|nr:2OG-Fe(II) oxygenase [Kofleriaceae bacterium]